MKHYVRQIIVLTIALSLVLVGNIFMYTNNASATQDGADHSILVGYLNDSTNVLQTADGQRAVIMEYNREENPNITSITLPQQAQVYRQSGGVENNANVLTFTQDASLVKIIYFVSADVEPKITILNTDETSIDLAVQDADLPVREVTEQELKALSVARAYNVDTQDGNTNTQERAASNGDRRAGDTLFPVDIDNITEKEKEILREASYDIKADPEKYKTDNWTFANTNNENAKMVVTSAISDDGNYVIWKVRAWHNSSTPRGFYLGFTPDSNLMQVLDRTYVTVSPFHFMNMLYSKIAGGNGYANERDGRDSLDRFNNKRSEEKAGFRAKNLAMVTRLIQEKKGIMPVRSDYQVEFTIRTKILDKNRPSYKMDFFLESSKWALGGWEYDTAKLTAEAQGTKQWVAVYRPPNTKGGTIPCALNNQYVIDRPVLDSSGNNVTCSIPDNGSRPSYTVWRADRFDSRGVPQKIAVGATKTLPTNYYLARIDADDPIYIYHDTYFFRDPNRRIAEAGTGYDETDRTRTIVSDSESRMEGSVAYSADGKHLIWTFFGYHSNSGQSYNRQFIDFSSDSNQNVTNRDNSWVVFYPRPDSNVRLDRSAITANPSVSNGMRNYGRGWVISNNADSIYNGEQSRHVIITDITNPDATEYTLRASIGYTDRGDALGSGYGNKTITLKIPGLKTLPEVSLDWIPSNSKIDVRSKFAPYITDGEGNKLTDMHWEGDSNGNGKYVANTKLPTFNSEGKRNIFHLEMNPTSDIAAKYDITTEFDDPYGAKHSVTLVRKEETEDRYGFVWADPLDFKFIDDADIEKYDYRFGKGKDYQGHYTDVRLYWRLPENAKSGDTFTLAFPKVVNIKAPESFDIYTIKPNGYKNSIAMCTIDPNNETVSCRLTADADEYMNLSGYVDVRPMIASPFDIDRDYRKSDDPCERDLARYGWCVNGAKDITYTTTYTPVKTTTTTTTSFDSKAYIKYKSDWKNDDKFNVLKKEDFSETDRTITYGIMANRKNNNLRTLVLTDIPKKPSGWGFMRWDSNSENPQNDRTTDPLQFVKIYAYPVNSDVYNDTNPNPWFKQGILRENVTNEYLIWPINGRAKSGWNVAFSWPDGKFQAIIQRTDGQSVGTVLMLLNAEKTPFYYTDPQVNNAQSSNKEVYSTRYPTYASSYTYAGERTQSTSKIKLIKLTMDTKKKIPGVEFRIYKKGDFNRATPNEGVMGKSITDQNGELVFYGVFPPGEYTLIEMKAPEGYQNDGRDINNQVCTVSNGIPVCNKVVEIPVTVTGEHEFVTLEVENPPKATLGDKLWVDRNGNGQQDLGESTPPAGVNLSGVRVYLYEEGNNTPIADTTLDANGKYKFVNLNNGKYSVKFVLPQSLNSYKFTTRHADINPEDTKYPDSVDSDVCPTATCTDGTVLGQTEFKDVTYNPNKADGALDNDTFDAGIKPPGRSISIRKFGDPQNLITTSGGRWTLPADGTASLLKLTGASFALYDSDPTVTGSTPIADGVTVDGNDASLFNTSLLVENKRYWLVETKAPDGFELLAEPISFKLATGKIELLRPNGTVINTASGSYVTDSIVVNANGTELAVIDTSSGDLPRAGGMGMNIFLYTGLILIVIALVMLLTQSRQELLQFFRLNRKERNVA